jgi:hypothetical protein
MRDLNDLLGEALDRELLVRPFDGRWEARLTIYATGTVLRGVGSTPTEAIQRCAEKHEGQKV